MKYRGESEAPEAALENRLRALEARIAEAIHFGRGYERLLRERRIAAKLLGTARVHRLLVEKGGLGPDLIAARRLWSVAADVGESLDVRTSAGSGKEITSASSTDHST